MAYVLRKIFERHELGGVIRRYEVETPDWHVAWDLDVHFPRLVELELHISLQCADYFRKVPYSLAETIWVQGLKPACFEPF